MVAGQSFGSACRKRLPMLVLSNSASLFQWCSPLRTQASVRQSILLPSRRFLSSGKKKKRRRKSRETTPVPVTKKDRIRSLEKRDDKIEFKLPTVSLEELPDTVESRLLQARKFIYSFWNDDASSTKSGAGAGARPPRVGPVMDARWWFWNLCFALMPAIVTAVYCEFWVEPEMRAYFKAMNEAQKRRIMGDDYVEEEDEIVIIPLEKPSLKERIQQSFQELVGLSTSSGVQEDQTMAVTTTEKSTIEPTAEEAPANLPSADHETTVKRRDDTQGDRRQEPSVTDKSQPQKMDEQDMLLLLQQRIDALEGQLENQQRRQKHQLNYQLERAGQSGIRNRVEDRWISEWEEEREQNTLKMQQQQQPPPPQQQQQQHRQQKQQQQQLQKEQVETRPDSNTTSREKIKEAALRGLRENLSAKKEAMERYGVDIMDRAWGFWDNNDDEEEKEQVKEDAVSKKEAGDIDVSSHAEVVKSVEEAAAATNRSAEIVVSSVSSSSDPSTASQAAAQAAVAAEEAAEAAHRAAVSVPSPPSSEQPPGIIEKTRRALFRRKEPQGTQEEQPKK